MSVFDIALITMSTLTLTGLTGKQFSLSLSLLRKIYPSRIKQNIPLKECLIHVRDFAWLAPMANR